jgi:hypothetical protein
MAGTEMREVDAPGGVTVAQLPVGVDGEALVLDTPVRCTIQPAALRVRVPRDRPGVPDPKPIMDWKRLRQLARARDMFNPIFGELAPGVAESPAVEEANPMPVPSS